MTTVVPSRELRNDTRGLLRRVEAGEEMVITVDGRPVARLAAVNRRPRFISREEFVRRFVGRQADPGLRADLDELAGDTTDDLPAL
jgi:prevent-host-death family protein